MIKVDRGPVPDFFVKYDTISKESSLRGESSYDFRRVWRNDYHLRPQLKHVLLKRFNRKCAYCESPVGENNNFHIEHFKPRSLYPSLTLSWDNLLLACNICGSMKSAEFPLDENREALLVDPCKDNPEDHFAYTRDGLIFGITEKGRITIEVLQLNRKNLVNIREVAMGSYVKILYTHNNSLKKITKKLKESPFSGIALFLMRIKNSNIVLDGPSLINERKQLKSETIWNEVISKVKIKSETIWNEVISKVKIKSETIWNEVISKVEIQNFKSIRETSINFNPLYEEENERVEMPILFLLGENGAGKSSILQALTVCLLGEEKVLSKTGITVDDILRKDGAPKKGFVKVYFEQGGSITLHFERGKGFRFEFVDRQKAPSVLLAYGAVRLARRAHESKFAFNIKEGVNIQGLFDPYFGLSNAKKFLLNLGDVDFNIVSEKILKPALSLSFEDSFKREKGQIFLVKESGEEIRYETLSSGYRVIIVLICDILKTTLEVFELDLEKQGFEKGAYLSTDKMKGVVMIDEIENHLHPRWKIEVMKTLRKVFPKMQFISSTHDPLCILNSYYGEVNVVEYIKPKNSDAQNSETIILGKESLPDHEGLSVQDILTSAFFGLLSTRADGMEEKMRRFYYLKSRNLYEGSDDFHELATLEKELKAYNFLGRNQRERLMLEAIDDYLEEQKRTANPEERAAKKAKLKALLKQIIKDK